MQKLTDTELEIMKCIWSFGRACSASEILIPFNETYGRDWSLQTLSSYLLRMAGKGYLKYQKNRRSSSYTALILEDDYFQKSSNDFIRLWGDGALIRMTGALIKENRISKEELKKLKKLMDGLV